MKQKINLLLNYCIPIVLIVCLLFFPYFKASSLNEDLNFTTRTIFGFHFLTGYLISGESMIETSSFLLSTTKAYVILFAPLSLLLSQKILKNEIGKSFVNFFLSGILFIYIFLLQFNAQDVLDVTYYGFIEFKSCITYSILVILCFAYFVYLTILLIKDIRMKSKEDRQEISLEKQK